MSDLSINVIRAVRPLNVQKLSSQIGAGRVIETVDGRRFRVVAKIAGAGGNTFRLVSHAGSLHVTASELAALEPLPHGVARLAHVLRFYAYNRDFTQYINEAIKAHGLPIDPQMDWSKWLYSQLTNVAKAHNEDQLDEALHEYIIDLIYEKDVLEQFDPKKFKKERNKNQDIARKVSIYLMRMFITYRSMLARTIERLKANVQGESIKSEKGYNTGLRENLDVPMMQPGEEDEEVNILDTPERAQAPEDPFAEADTWENISRFRAEYGDWLVDTERPETAENILKLFDLIVNAEQKAKDDVVKPSEFTNQWMNETGKSLARYGQISMALSQTLQKFVEIHPELAETSLIARMIGDIKSKKPTTKSKNEGPKSVPRAASLSLVAIAPSELAEIPGDTGRLPHDNTGNESSAVIILEDAPKKPNRTVAPEIPAIQHGF